MREPKPRVTAWMQADFDDGKYHLEIVGERIFAVYYALEPACYFELGQLVKEVGGTHDNIHPGTTGHIICIRNPDLVENKYAYVDDSSRNAHYILEVMFDSFPTYLPVEYDPNNEVYRGGYRRRTIWQVKPAPLPEFSNDKKDS